MSASNFLFNSVSLVVSHLSLTLLVFCSKNGGQSTSEDGLVATSSKAAKSTYAYFSVYFLFDFPAFIMTIRLNDFVRGENNLFLLCLKGGDLPQDLTLEERRAALR